MPPGPAPVTLPATSASPAPKPTATRCSVLSIRIAMARQHTLSRPRVRTNVSGGQEVNQRDQTAQGQWPVQKGPRQGAQEAPRLEEALARARLGGRPELELALLRAAA